MRTLAVLLLVSLALLGHVTSKTKKASKKDIAAYKAEHQKWLDLYKYKPEKAVEKGAKEQKKKGVKEASVPGAPAVAPAQQQLNQNVQQQAAPAPAEQQANQVQQQAQEAAKQKKEEKAKAFQQKKKAAAKKKQPQ